MTKKSIPKFDAETGEAVFGPYVRRPYERTRLRTVVIGESKTHQSHAGASDVNNIVERYQRTGLLPPPRFPPQYADVTALQGDLTERLEFARDVQARSSEFAANWVPPAPVPPKEEAVPAAKPPEPTVNK